MIRILLSATLITLVFSLSGCGDKTTKQIEDINQKLDDSTSRLDSLKDQLDSLENENDSMQARLEISSIVLSEADENEPSPVSISTEDGMNLDKIKSDYHSNGKEVMVYNEEIVSSKYIIIETSEKISNLTYIKLDSTYSSETQNTFSYIKDYSTERPGNVLKEFSSNTVIILPFEESTSIYWQEPNGKIRVYDTF